MLRKLLMYIACCTLFLAQNALADEVVKWVDANGVTHFGNPQFAPPAGAEAVEVQQANGMEAPNLKILERAPDTRTLNGVVVERAQNKNPRGWRGYWKRASIDRRPGRRG